MAVIPAITTTALDPQIAADLILVSLVDAVLPIPAEVTVRAAPEPISVNQKNPAGYPTG